MSKLPPNFTHLIGDQNIKNRMSSTDSGHVGPEISEEEFARFNEDERILSFGSDNSRRIADVGADVDNGGARILLGEQPSRDADAAIPLGLGFHQFAKEVLARNFKVKSTATNS